MYALQLNINVAKQKCKKYVIQTIINFAYHKGKTANKNKKGKKSSVIPIFSMADRRGKWSLISVLPIFILAIIEKGRNVIVVLSG